MWVKSDLFHCVARRVASLVNIFNRVSWNDRLYRYFDTRENLCYISICNFDTEFRKITLRVNTKVLKTGFSFVLCSISQGPDVLKRYLKKRYDPSWLAVALVSIQAIVALLRVGFHSVLCHGVWRSLHSRCCNQGLSVWADQHLGLQTHGTVRFWMWFSPDFSVFFGILHPLTWFRSETLQSKYLRSHRLRMHLRRLLK